MAVNTTQVEAEVLLGVTSPLRITELRNDVSYEVDSHLNVTQARADSAYQIDSHLQVTRMMVQVLMPVSPNFDWIEMFIYEKFPDDISYNSIGATRFQTDVVIVDSGFDQRVSRWDQPLMEYDVAYGVRTFEQLHALIAFFRAMQGKKNAFLYYDWVDHTSTLATALEARQAPPIGPFDQVLGVGDKLTYQFQLQKTYPTPRGAASSVRPIYKPVVDTVEVGVALEQVTNFTVNRDTGVVTFTPRVTKANIASVVLAYTYANVWTLTAPAGTWSEFVVGDGLVLSGFTSPANNTTLAQVLEVTGVNGDGSVLSFHTTVTGFGSACTQENATVSTHPAPRQGQQVTAGYEFYVPVRFDTDRLPVTLEEYGVGGAADVKLIEVRPNAS